MQRIWNVHPHDEALIESLAKSCNVSPVIAQFLSVRGIRDPEQVKFFLNSPLQDLRAGDLLPGVTTAVKAIKQSIQDNERIIVYGDYDADGMTATAILVRCLKLCGADVSYYVPNRLDDGYGLNDEAIRKLADGGAKMVITVDCGIASVDHAQTARDLGLKLIITDHHQFGEQLPDAVALVHPGLPQAEYPFAGLCGAGVALKLAWTLCQEISGQKKVPESHRNFLLQAMGLASIGTVADVVPLLDENRLIVKHGLGFLKQFAPPGLMELMKVTGLDKKRALSAEDIGFTIGPRLNAAGRLGQAQLGVELLTTESPQRANSLAEYIHQLNDSRDSLERKIHRAANSQIRDNDWDDSPAIVLADRNWHPGVIGIVAGRLAEKYNRPTILIALDETGNKPGVGSARSACGVNLHEALNQCSELLISCGGHKQAAGLQISESNVEAFRDLFCQYVSEHTVPTDFEPQLRVDAEVPLSAMNLAAVNDLERMAPFGESNPRPIFCASDVTISQPPKKIGGGERHLSLQVEQHDVRFRCVSFGNAAWADDLISDGTTYDIAFQPFINEFRGRRSVELQIIDWRPGSERQAVAATQNAGTEI